MTAATSAAATLEALGFTVRTDPVQVPGGVSATVVADRVGSRTGARRVVLITAHLDSINIAGGPTAVAPGADDNASGAAGILELGRVLVGVTWQHDLRLLLFGGEEQGLFGSRQYVAALPLAERSRIRAVLNLDMIGRRNGPSRGVLLEGGPASAHLVDDLAAAATSVTGLQVSTSLSPFASDHVPFLEAGIPAVLAIEDSDSSNHDIHSDRDVVAHIEPGLALEILRMCLATLLRWLDSRPRPRPAGPVVARAPGRLDVFVVGSDSAMHHQVLKGPAG
nr:M20/M25/M40 family metallo-hydrolase [Kineococcus vitellinus]